MYKIVLINMPFAAGYRPSIALTQLKSALELRYGQQVEIKILYLNQSFVQYMGLELYQEIAEGIHYNFGLGDWFFRQAAFPELADNAEDYFLRYYPRRDEQTQHFRQLIEAKREDLDQYLDQIVVRHELDLVDMVGFTSMFSQNVASFAMAKRLKEWNPDIVTVIGGANCETPMGQEIAKYVSQIDFVFSGPGLMSFPEFVGYCMQNQSEKCHFIDGVFSRLNCTEKAPQIQMKSISTPKIEVATKKASQEIGKEMNLDETITLDYTSFLDDFERNFVGLALRPTLLFETSRGCWWGERSHCTFCGLNGLTMNYRSMSALHALDQLHALFKYSDRCSILESVDNILPKSYLKEVLPLLKPPANVTIFYEVKANLSEEEVELLAQAHINTIQPGIEALATSTLQLMKKGSNAFQNVLLLKYCAMYDVFPVWNLLIGFPNEEEAVYEKYVQDIPLLLHLPPPSGPYPVRFDRFSPYFMQRDHYSLDLHPCDFYELIYPFEKQSLEQLAYYFTDRTVEAPYVKTTTKWINRIREQTAKWRNRWDIGDVSSMPKLFLQAEHNEASIYDSRSDKVLQYPLTTNTWQMLEILNKPTKLADLATKLSHIPLVELEASLKFAQEHGLIFSEGERHLSLVLPREPSSMKSFYQIRKGHELNADQPQKIATGRPAL